MVTDINQGVEYRYLAPLQEPRRHRHQRQQQQEQEPQHRWRVKLLGGCSRSCGGGVQATVAACVRVTRGSSRHVPDSRCPADTRPPARHGTEPSCSV